jgi:hypothetical protein
MLQPDYESLAIQLTRAQAAKVIPMPMRSVPALEIDPVARAADAVSGAVADFVIAAHAAKTPGRCAVIALEIDHLLVQMEAAKCVALDAATRLEPVA